MTKVVERINELRKERNLTCQELARLAGITPATLINWNKGRTKPNPVLLKKVADALGCDYNELFKLL